MTPTLRRLAPFAALALLAATPHATALDGWRFSWQVTSLETNGKKTEANTPPSMTVSFVPGKMRIEFPEGSVPKGQKKGTYMLMDATSGEMTIVVPEERSAMIMNLGAVGGAMGSIGQSRLMRMDVSDAKTGVEKLGAGDKILGHATTRYRITRDYTMTITVMGRKNRSTHHSVTEAWFASERFIDDKVFEAWSQSYTGGMNGMIGDAMKTLQEADAAVPKGILLKQIVTSSDTDDKGNKTESKLAMEMRELERASLDASLFRIPDGYDVTDMKKEMAAASDSMRIAKAECEKDKGKGNCDMPSMDSVLKAGVEETKKDAAKKALRGLLKKPGGN